MRVLIADDDRDAVMTLGILLRSEGFEVQLAHGGLDVPELVRSFKPRAVLLDIAMPDRSGYEVAEALHKDYGVACPVLIAVTARSNPAEKLQAEISGFHYFIPKPYDAQALLGLLGAIDRSTEKTA